MLKLSIHLSDSYDVLIERGLFGKCGSLIHSICGGSRLLIVCGDTVHGLYADALAAQLSECGYDVHRFVYPHGEKSKSPEVFISLLNRMVEYRLDRSDIVVALGGGVTGDIAGFASACFMRGIRYVYIPTTLLSMVDSCIGGKTGIDLPSGKNLAGAIYQPSLVICDPELLSTLPTEHISDGCAEAVKYALLSDPSISELLSDMDSNAEELIFRCLSIKKRYIEADEFDVGLRRFLNLGHTVGHAVEKLSDYEISHGKAVALGLCTVTKAAERAGDCQIGTYARLGSLLTKLGLPTQCKYAASELCKLIWSDKKRNSVDITLIVPRSFGDCFLKTLTVSEACMYLLGETP